MKLFFKFLIFFSKSGFGFSGVDLSVLSEKLGPTKTNSLINVTLLYQKTVDYLLAAGKVASLCNL